MDKYEKAALRFTNKIRAELGLEPLEQLEKGNIGIASSCTLSASLLNAEGLWPRTDYDFVDIIDIAPILGDDGPYFSDSSVGYVDAKTPKARVRQAPRIVKSFKVPTLVKTFLRFFDDGKYPHLVTDDIVTLP